MAVKHWTAPLLIATALLAGCQSNSPKQETPQFLQSYSGFRDHPYVDGARLWVKPGVNRKQIVQYEQFILAPIEIWPSEEGYPGVTAIEVQAMSEAFREAIRSQLEPEFKITDKPGTNTAYVRIALTEISRNDPEKGVLDFIPVRLLINAGKDAVLAMQDKEYKITNAKLELEFYDSETGELLATMIDRQNGGKEIRIKSQAGFEDVQKLFEIWGKRFKTTLISLR